jgi:hypothetical protein
MVRRGCLATARPSRPSRPKPPRAVPLGWGAVVVAAMRAPSARSIPPGGSPHRSISPRGDVKSGEQSP